MNKTGIDKLDVFNKMVLLRDGKVPVDVVFLIGNDNDLQKAIQLEKKILGAFFKENLMSKYKGVYFTDLKKSKEILEEHKFKTMNIDVTGIAPTIDYETFISELGLDGLSEAVLDEYLSDELKENIKTDREKVVLATLMYHYEKYDDNVFRDDDFSWFNGGKRKENTEDYTKSGVHTHKHKKNGYKQNNEDVNNGCEGSEEKRPVHGSGASILGSYRNSPLKKDIEVADDIDEETGILKPEVVEEKRKLSYITKEVLTDEEEKNNKRLLSELRAKYEDVIGFIEEMCNSQYRIILNKMQDAYKTNIYKQQYCPMYLEISDDRKTLLYHKLYEIDMATIEFQKRVVHQIKHMGCYNCGHEWDEETTFLPAGPRRIGCPKCYHDNNLEKV